MTSAAAPRPRGARRSLYVGLTVALIILAGEGGYLFANSSVTTVTTTQTGTAASLKVLATFIPLQEWAQAIGGNKVNVSLLVSPGIDVHEFEPSPAAIHAVATANILILNGAGLEPWASQVIASADNPRLVVVNCSEGIGLIRVPAQFQSGRRTLDPHTWLDPVDAIKMVQNILTGYIKADPASSTYFTTNADSYINRLKLLDGQFASLAKSNLATRNFVTFHTSFGYLAEQYGLTQVPVFGPFEEEPTAADIAKVGGVINQNRLCYVGYESLEDPAISASIAAQTNATLVPMNPIEGLTSGEQALGQTYLTLMAQTYLVLSLSLNHVGC